MLSHTQCNNICISGRATSSILCEQGYSFIPPKEEISFGSKGRFKVTLAIIGRMGSNTVFCDNVNVVKRLLNLGTSVYQDIVSELLHSLGLRGSSVSLGVTVNNIRIPSFCELVCILRKKLRDIASRLSGKNLQGSQWWCFQALNDPVIAIFKIEALGKKYSLALPLAAITNNSDVPEVCRPLRGCSYSSLPIFWCRSTNLIFIGYPFCELNNYVKSCDRISSITCPLAYMLRYLGPNVRNAPALASKLCDINVKVLINEFNRNGVALDATCSDVYEYMIRTSWVTNFGQPRQLSLLSRYSCGIQEPRIEIEYARGSISLKFHRVKLRVGRGRLSSNIFDYYPSVILYAKIHDTYYISLKVPDDIVSVVVSALQQAPLSSLQSITLAFKAILLTYAVAVPAQMPSVQTVIRKANRIARLSLARPQVIELSISGLRKAAMDIRDNAKEFANLIRDVALALNNGRLKDFLEAISIHTLANALTGALLYKLDLDEDSIGTIVFGKLGTTNTYEIVIFENIEGGLAAINTVSVRELVKGLQRLHAIWSRVHMNYKPTKGRLPNLGQKYNPIYQELDNISNILKNLTGTGYTVVPSWVARLGFTGDWVERITGGKVSRLEWNSAIAEVIPAYFDLDMHDADNSTLILEKARRDLDDDVQRLLISGYALQAWIPVLTAYCVQVK